MIFVTEFTEARVPEPAQEDATLTDTFAAGMVPEGNPEPVTFTAVTPAAPELGAVKALRLTDCATLACADASKTTQPRAMAPNALMLRPIRNRRRISRRPISPVPARMKALG